MPAKHTALTGTPTAGPPPLPYKLPSELLTAWLLLLLDRGASYGYELQRELHARQLRIDPSVIYRSLRRLEIDEYVASRWTPSTAGPKRRCYRLTQSGRAKLNEAAALLADIRDLHNIFIQIHQQPPQ